MATHVDSSVRSALHHHHVLSSQASLPALAQVAALLSSLVLVPAPALANPTGGVVVGGEAAITQGPGVTTVDQTSGRAIIDWQGFSIDRGERTQFRQPGKEAIALNRVIGNDPSSILGQLEANGNVWLINRNGILFGRDAKVDVHGLLATTADIRNEDFMAGRYDFAIPSPKPDAAVINEGTISIGAHGLAGLVAPHVRNAGIIQGRLGQVVIAGAPTFTLDFYGDGLIQFEATSKVTEELDREGALVEQDGTIKVDGGKVLITADAASGVVDDVINMNGLVEARSFQVADGSIVLDGGEAGTVRVAGELNASGAEPGTNGGTVDVLGKEIELDSGARIDVSGPAGGGAVHVGGDKRGDGRRTAMRTAVMRDARISADATVAGDGGEVIVWSEGSTRVAGTLTATGGADFGNGGFIETSGLESVSLTGTIDASAPNGIGGTWLIDPTDITIDAELAASISQQLSAGTSVEIDTASIDDQKGNITQLSNAAITKTDGDTATLMLRAENSIFLNAPISSTSNHLNVVLNADSDGSDAGAIFMLPGSSISSNGGFVTLGGGSDPATMPAVGTATDIDGDGVPNPGYVDGVILEGATITSDGGDIHISGKGYTGAPSDASGIDVRNSGEFIALISSGTGNVFMTGVGGGDGSGVHNRGINIQNGAGVESAGIGSLTLNGTAGSGTDGNIGVFGSSAFLRTGDGDITMVGRGGVTATGVGSRGINLQDGTRVESAGLGSIILNGTGGSGTNDTIGIFVSSESLIGSVNGSISLTGTGGTAGDISRGIHLQSGSLITSTASGEISLNGTPGGTDSFSILAIDTSGIVSEGLTRLDGTRNISVASSGNDLGTVAFTARNIELADTDDLRFVASSAEGNFFAAATGQIRIDGPIRAGGNIVLDPGLGVTQDAPMVASGLALQGSGPFYLTNPRNDIGILAASVFGDIEYVDVNELTIGEVAELSGIRTDSGNVTVHTPNGRLNVNNSIDAAGLEGGLGDVTLSTGEASETTSANLFLSANVVGNTVQLVSADAIRQFAGTVSATGLRLIAAEAAMLGQDNDIDALAGEVGGALSFRDNDGFNISTVGQTVGLTSDSTITLDAGDSVFTLAPIAASGLELLGMGSYFLFDANNDVETLAGKVGAAVEYRDIDGFTIGAVGISAGLSASLGILLGAGGEVTQSEPLSGSSLDLVGAGPYLVTHPLNNVETLAANTLRGIQYTDADDLRLVPFVILELDAATLSDEAIRTVDADVSVRTLAGPLSLEGPVAIGAAALELQAGGTGSDLVLNADVLAHSVLLRADNIISQGLDSAITAAELGIEGAAAPSLNLGSNDVDVIAANITGEGNPFAFTDVDDLQVGQVGALTGIRVNNGDVMLDVGGNLMIGEPLSAGTLGNLTLIADGTVTQTAAVTTGRLALFGAGSFEMLSPNNDAQTLTADVGGAVAYRDASDLTIRGIDIAGLAQESAIGFVPVGIAAQTVRLFVPEDLILEAPIATSDSIVIDTGRFLNNTVPNALDPGEGRFLVYSTTETEDVRGDLDQISGILGNRTYLTDPSEQISDPDPVLNERNLFLYADYLGTLRVTALPVSREYGDANPDPLPYVADFSELLEDHATLDLVVDGEPDVSTNATPWTNVDESPVEIAVGLGDFELLQSHLGYQFELGNSLLEITPAPLSVIVNDSTREYGDPNAPFSADFIGFKLEQDASVLGEIVFDTPAEPGSPVLGSPYAITVLGFDNTNYVLGEVADGALSVTPAPLTITANDVSRLFGQDNPAFTASYSGFKLEDDPSVVIGLQFASTADRRSFPGDYVIESFGASAANYSLAFIPGTLTVEPGPMTTLLDGGVATIQPDTDIVSKFAPSVPIELATEPGYVFSTSPVPSLMEASSGDFQAADGGNPELWGPPTKEQP